MVGYDDHIQVSFDSRLGDFGMFPGSIRVDSVDVQVSNDFFHVSIIRLTIRGSEGIIHPALNPIS